MSDIRQVPPLDINRRGRMTYPSKTSAPRDHVHVFNGHVITANKDRLWNGDLDLTIDTDVLKSWAQERGETLYILREYDGHPSRELDLGNAVAVFEANGTVTMMR